MRFVNLQTSMVAIALATLGPLGCSSSGSSSDNTGVAQLTVTFGDQPGRSLDTAAHFGLLEDSLIVRVVDGNTTVFVGVPRAIAGVGALQVGKEPGQEVVVWARDGESTPQTATNGTLEIATIELTSGGGFEALLVASKNEDEFGEPTSIEGRLVGTWP